MSGRWPPSTVGGRIARGELHRTTRSVRETAREVIGLSLLGLLVLAFAIGGSALAYLFGQGIRTDSSLAELSIVPGARAVVGFCWFILTATVAFRTVTTIGDVHPESLLLTAVPIRELVAGKLLAEGTTITCWIALPLLCVSVAFAVGVASPWVLLTLPVVGLLVLASGIAAGFLLGLLVRHLVTRYEPIVRVKTPLAIALVLVYLGIFVTGAVNSLFAALYQPIQLWPIGWLADLLFVGVAGVSSSVIVGTAGSVVTVALLALTLALAPRVAAFHWLSDRPRTPPSDPFPRRTATLEHAFDPFTSRSVRAVAGAVWRRTVRAPIRLVFLIYPAFFLIEPARQTLESLQATGTVPATIPPLVLAYVVWASGMAFTLNPLGDQGATLPTTVSVAGAGRAVVRGRVVAGAVTMVPLALVLVGSVTLLSTASTFGVALLLTATVVGVVAALTLATGIGVAFPRFGAVSVTRSRQVVMPSKTAAVVYSVAVFALVGCLSMLVYEPAWEPIAALLSLLVTAATPTSDGISVAVVRGLGVLLFVPLAAIPLFSYRYAVRRIETYTLE